MASQGIYLTVKLRDVDDLDSIPFRSIVLREPSWSIKIGRGTHNGDGELCPAEDNAWFDSKVMSRNHAILRANPTTKGLTIEDVGSMHGTFVEDRKVKKGLTETVLDDDVITFGTKVVRGTASFPALDVVVNLAWSDDNQPITTRPKLANGFRNSFSADYSDDEPISVDDSDADVLIESRRQPSVEIVIPPRKFAVPESVDSSGGSRYSSEEPHQEEASMSSSPVVSTHDENPKQNKVTADVQLRAEQPNFNAQSLVDDSSVVSISDYEDSDVFDGEDVDKLDEISKVDIMTSSPVQNLTSSPRIGTSPPAPSKPDAAKLRTPSPSDAALAKASQTITQSSPFAAQSPTTNSTGYGYGGYGHDAQRRDNYTWTCNNSVLYEPIPILDQRSQYEVFNPESAAFIENRPESQGIRSYDTREWYLDPSRGYSLDVPNRGGMENMTDLFEPTSDGSGKPWSAEHLPVGSQQNADTTYEEPSSSTTTLKRKADQISSSQNSCTGQQQESLEEVTTSTSVAPSSQAEESILVADSFVPQQLDNAAFVTIKSPVRAQDEPARKKAKKSKSDKGSRKHKKGGSFAKYAATALAGAAVGVVGTIFGLVALPQDYFV